MPGLEPGIHVFASAKQTAWMAGSSPAMTTERVDPVARRPIWGKKIGRRKAGQDWGIEPYAEQDPVRKSPGGLGG